MYRKHLIELNNIKFWFSQKKQNMSIIVIFNRLVEAL